MSEHTKRQLNKQMSAYSIGFILSIVLTIAPYLLVTRNVITGAPLIISLLVFAVLQLLVQVTFFLHLGDESRPRWNLYSLIFAAIVVLILVIGSMWIMHNLDYNMSHGETDQEIIKDEGYAQ
jgi:cytochrome o ubiquinol oxidase operon protein cyoD